MWGCGKVKWDLSPNLGSPWSALLVILVSAALKFSLSPYVKKKENNLTTTTQKNLDHLKKNTKSLTYVKFNLIYFYTSSCQFKEQQQSSHLCLISSIHCRWSRERGFWTEAEHVARSQPPPPPPRALGPGGGLVVPWEQRGAAPGHLGQTCCQQGKPSSLFSRHNSPPDFSFAESCIVSPTPVCGEWAVQPC